VGALSSHGVPQHGQERGDGSGKNIGITLCGEDFFFSSSVSSGASAQFETSPIGLSHDIFSKASSE